MYFAFNILFNYTLAVMISPGKLNEYYEQDETKVSLFLKNYCGLNKFIAFFQFKN
jgi:hypothetical protein